MPDVFLSYARLDQDLANIIAGSLERNGLSVWWDFHIKPGDYFDKSIEKALLESNCVVVLWTSNSINSEWVKEEAFIAQKQHKLIPVLLDDVDIPIGFRRIQTIDLRLPSSRNLEDLTSALVIPINAVIANLPKALADADAAQTETDFQVSAPPESRSKFSTSLDLNSTPTELNSAPEKHITYPNIDRKPREETEKEILEEAGLAGMVAAIAGALYVFFFFSWGEGWAELIWRICLTLLGGFISMNIVVWLWIGLRKLFFVARSFFHD